VRVLVASLGFFTQIPIGRDEKSYESLRRNLWVIPFTGFVIGCLIAVPSYLLCMFLQRLAFASIIFYILVEGINHIDGLADFSDSLFVSKEKKIDVLKDTRTGVGGVLAVLLYLVILSFSFSNLSCEDVLAAIILSQTAAKLGMLVLLTTSKPLWNGMASNMMEFASKRQLCIGLLITSIIFGAFSTLFPQSMLLLVLTLMIILLYRRYILRIYGGVNGDMVGALNCILFAFGIFFFVV
jgi:adenosylcobinamide-GDP ribazoletransferase